MAQAFPAIKLDKAIPVPLYYQLKKQLLTLIEQGALKEGDKLPPENELCEQLGVSRPTVRQAFGELASEGYLHRFKGTGTFVAAPKISARFFSKLESFDREMRQKGKVPHTQVLTLEKTSAFPKANEALGLQLDTPLVHLSRLRFADEVPLVLVDTYLSHVHYSPLLDVDFNHTSLYDALEQRCGTRVHHVVREIEAVNARRKEANLLQISQNKALVLVRTLAYAPEKPNPVEYSIARYRGDLNTFSVEIYR